MRNTVKLLCTLFAFTLLALCLCIPAFAEDSEAPTEEPCFSVTDAEGNVTTYTNAGKINTAFSSMETGSTLTLLSDIQARDFAVKLIAKSGAEVYFDFAGHTMNCEVKENIFVVDGNSTVIHVYSSLPGAKVFGRDPSTGQGSNLISMKGTDCTAYLGAYGDHSGDNISVYLPAFIDHGGPASSHVYVDGGNYYRNIGDWSGFVITRQDGYVSIKNANVFGVNSTLKFNLAGVGGVMDIENCYVANLDTKAGMIANFNCNSMITFTDCVFSEVLFNADSYGTPTGAQVGGRAVIEGNTSYSEAPSFTSWFEVYTTDNLVRVNRPIDFVPEYNVYGSYPYSYDMIPVTDLPTGMYVYAQEGEFSQIEWEIFNDLVSEEWLNGEIPVCPFDIPEDDETFKFTMDEILPVDGCALYSVEAERNFQVFYNLNVYSAVDVNVYIPTAVKISVINVAGSYFEADDFTSAEIVEIDGVECYKLSKTGLRYDMLAVDYRLTLTMTTRWGNEMVEVITSYSLDVARYLGSVLDGDFDSADKDFVKEFVAYVKETYEKSNSTLPQKFEDLLA